MSIIESGNILVTGGAGTLGRAIAARRLKDGWSGKLTVYSTDTHKHDHMRKMFPDVNFIQGDIRNPETMYHAMVGHDIVIHAGAVKVIPTSEYQSLDTFDVNVNGSINVCAQALRANIEHVIAISTDKVCHAANAYGASKYMMEKVFQEYGRLDTDTDFHLVRYGNVLESTGSVIEAWKKQVAGGNPIKITSPHMTRFWLSPAQAVDVVIDGLEATTRGMIYVGKMPALSIGKLAEYTVGDVPVQFIPIRPGEKMHETLLTFEESYHAEEYADCFIVMPTTWDAGALSQQDVADEHKAYSSDIAPELTKDQLNELLNG